MSRRKRSDYVLHLFNDVLLYSSEGANSKFLLHQVFELASCAVSADVSSLAGKLNPKELRRAFGISAASKSFIVIVDSEEEKQLWIKDLTLHIGKERDALARRDPEGASAISFAAAFVPDDTRTACNICLAAFTLKNRRHHCRKCGELVCDACSLHRRLLPHISQERVRLCDVCEDKSQALGVSNIRLLAELIGATCVFSFLFPHLRRSFVQRTPLRLDGHASAWLRRARTVPTRCSPTLRARTHRPRPPAPRSRTRSLPLAATRHAWCVVRYRQPLAPQLEFQTLPAAAIPVLSSVAVRYVYSSLCLLVAFFC